ncbi:MAG: hypothetical protein GY811_26590 [Myxococcales bacterium]|nr:hypothetical protein [Myxococcales bacterium]
MLDALRKAMKAIEAAPESAQLLSDATLRFASLAGLGSKYLAVGTPMSMGLVHCNEYEEALIQCHTHLFGELEILNNKVVGVETAMAADIVCLTSDTDFELMWIADATHLNMFDTGIWSAGMRELSRACDITYLNAPAIAPGRAHGLLADVIGGSVSGRMGEEITALLA